MIVCHLREFGNSNFQSSICLVPGWCLVEVKLLGGTLALLLILEIALNIEA